MWQSGYIKTIHLLVFTCQQWLFDIRSLILTMEFFKPSWILNFSYIVVRVSYVVIDVCLTSDDMVELLSIKKHWRVSSKLETLQQSTPMMLKTGSNVQPTGFTTSKYNPTIIKLKYNILRLWQTVNLHHSTIIIQYQNMNNFLHFNTDHRFCVIFANSCIN